MTPQDLVAAFEVVAEAPEGVVQLRDLVLQLAVTGKLVPQIATARLASSLDQHRAASVEKRESEPSGVAALPVGWTEARLGDVASLIQPGFACAKSNQVKNGHVHLRTHNVGVDGELNLDLVVRVRPDMIEPAKAGLRAGDVLFNNTNSRELVGKTCIVREPVPFAFSNHLTLIRVRQGMVPDFLAICLRQKWRSSYFQRTCNAWIGQAGVNSKALKAVLVPVPPEAEQHRIVARVDELMGLLDRLEAARTKREATRTAARDSALAALREADSPEAVDAAWTRFAQRMDDLLCDPADIASLRQTVLQLAVRGRLVQQDPSDDPPFAFLARIAAEKVRKNNAARSQVSAGTLPVGEEEEPFDVPQSWCWVRFGETHINRDAERIPLSRDERSGRTGPFDYYGASGVIDKVDAFLFDRTELLVGEDGANLLLRSTPIAFLAHGKDWVNNHAHVLDSLDLDSLAFLAIFVNATDLKPYVTGTAQPKLNQARMNSIPCPFPPLAEQRRIVARVNQLASLLDQLEQRLAVAKATHAAFASAAAHHVVA